MRCGLKNILILMSALAVVGCGNAVKSTSTSSRAAGTLPSTPSTPPTVSSSAPLALGIYTVYEGTKAVNDLRFSETGTTTCQATASSPNATCTVVVPEGRLYFSDINFQFAWMNDQCKLLIFQPYYYKASVSATYLPPGADETIDCSGAATIPPAACWGGAAPNLVTGFPKYVANIYIPDETQVSGPQSKIEVLKSGHSLIAGSNRFVVNDMPVGKVGNTYTPVQVGGVGDGYVANTMVNYKWICRDDWFDLATYTIDLYVTDEDNTASSGAPADDFYTWKELP